uniref:Ig-like domain-containing protein n=1 Tax=Seriola lalandi dorsalis TaxID=1841481 RepID=A0A3B4WX84_SERLL
MMEMMLISVSTGVYSIDLIQPDSVVVQPGQSLTITCQVSGYSLTDNSYATGWIRQREGKLEWIVHQWGGGLFYTAESAQLTSVSFIQCSVKNVLCLYSWYFNRTFVFPFLATSTGPTVFPLRPCSSGTGDMVSLGCLATGFTPSSLTFTWDKNGAALTDFIQYPPVQKGNVYTGVTQIQVRRQDWNDKANFKCVATHPAGTDGAIVAPPPPPPLLPNLCLLKALASSNDEKEASFSCYAKDFSPEEYDIKWLKSGEEINNKIYEIKTPTTTNLKNGTKFYSAASFLTVPSHDLLPQTEFTCEFKGKRENGYEFTNSSVIYNKRQCNAPDVELKIEGPKVEDLFLHGKGTITCKVNGQGVDKMFWEDQYGNEMPGALQGPFNGKPLSLPLDISYDEWNIGVKRYCVVEHENFQEPLKKLYERNIGKTVHAMEVEEDNMGGTALTFILLFLITLLFTIGTTVFKVTMSLYV